MAQHILVICPLSEGWEEIIRIPSYFSIHKDHQQCSAQGQVLHCKLRHQGGNSAQRQVFHCKLRNLGCSFTRDEYVGAVASRWFPHPTHSLASEKTLKDLKRSQGHKEEVSRVDLDNWALRTSPKFTTGLKYVSSGILTRSEIRKSQSPFAPKDNKKNNKTKIQYVGKLLFKIKKREWENKLSERL